MPGESVDTLDSRIVYIGETCRELDRRWRYFEQAARDGKARHSGGRTFHSICERPVSQLLVSAWTPAVPDVILRNAYIRYVERKLILEWVKKHDERPLCNRE